MELDRIGAILAAERLPLLVGADFNSTYDHERFRNLLRAAGRDGAPLLDAAEYLGSGIVATYPADRGFPAVLAIDNASQPTPGARVISATVCSGPTLAGSPPWTARRWAS